MYRCKIHFKGVTNNVFVCVSGAKISHEHLDGFNKTLRNSFDVCLQLIIGINPIQDGCRSQPTKIDHNY